MKASLKSFVRKNLVIFVFLAVYLMTAASQQSFLPFQDFCGLLMKSISLMIVVLGLGLIMIGGGVDLSVGNQISLISAVVGFLSSRDLPPALVILGAIGTGALCGCLNGVMVSRFRVPPFAATIGTQVIFYGASFFLSRGRMTAKIPDAIRNLSRADTIWVRTDLWIWAGVLMIVVLLMRFSIVGKYLRAAGLNEQTALRTGVPVRQIQFASYIFGGVCYATAALIMISGRGYTGSEIGLQMEIIALIAVYISGVRDRTTFPAVWKLLLGAVSTSIFSSGYLEDGANGYLRYVLLGIIMLITMAANRRNELNQA